LKSLEFPLWKNFYRENPLETFEPDSDDLWGWNSGSRAFELAIREVNPKVIIEVGSWKGLSAIHMANLAPEAQILCIDTWLGSPEMVGLNTPLEDHLKRLHGWPQIYFSFASNVIRHIGRERICPLPVPSTVASVLLSKMGFQADLIYIDGSHEYLDVVRDLDDYWPLLRSGGIMLVDDYGFPSVRKAVEERLPNPVDAAEKAIVRKP
jgi:predicted O-methyltransferase YrrM